MDRKTLMQIAVAVAAVVIAIVGALHYLRQDTRTCEVDDTLEPIAALIDENRSIIDGLRNYTGVNGKGRLSLFAPPGML